MVYTIRKKEFIRVNDRVFKNLISKYDTLNVLFFRESYRYVIAIKIPNKKYYYLESTTINGMKIILRYFGLKLRNIKLKKDIFLIKKP
jgi:hypothetical protein